MEEKVSEQEPPEKTATQQEKRLAAVKNKGGAAIKSALWLYAGFTLAGVVLGGLGAGFGAAYFDAGGFLVTCAALLGLAIGGILGFFCGQIAVAVMVEEMVFEAGMKASNAGLKGLRGFVAKARAKKSE